MKPITEARIQALSDVEFERVQGFIGRESIRRSRVADARHDLAIAQRRLQELTIKGVIRVAPPRDPAQPKDPLRVLIGMRMQIVRRGEKTDAIDLKIAEEKSRHRRLVK